MAEHQSSNILVMYSQEFCPTCVKARRTLTEEGVDFEGRPAGAMKPHAAHVAIEGAHSVILGVLLSFGSLLLATALFSR